MRTIIYPDPIIVRTGAVSPTGEPLTTKLDFAEFVHDNILTHFGQKLKDVRRALKIYDKLVMAKPGEEVTVDGSDWDKMKDILDTGNWNVFLALQVGPFFETIENATET